MFVGSITVGNLRCDGVEISVGDSSSFLTYINKNTERGKTYYGEMFTDNKLTQLTISVLGEEGIMISAPAKDRVDAVKISNELMKNVLEENFKFK
ncbi:hypothetical protein [Clostridium sp.]|uniref:hypothetical protein n=1 Tax=Clostridium sp. TaxID=1506 RepID=UPI003D6D74AD